MTRAIKFRAWEKPIEDFEGEMHYTSDYGKDEENYIKRLVVIAGFYHDSGWDWDDFILMQYTGLKDKNGVDIYEGDVVVGTINVPEDRFIVEYLEDTASFVGARHVRDPKSVGKVKQFSLIFSDRPMYVPDWEVEIIGNIYENPELLN